MPIDEVLVVDPEPRIGDIFRAVPHRELRATTTCVPAIRSWMQRRSLPKLKRTSASGKELPTTGMNVTSEIGR
jgi:hypothetical protein